MLYNSTIVSCHFVILCYTILLYTLEGYIMASKKTDLIAIRLPLELIEKIKTYGLDLFPKDSTYDKTKTIIDLIEKGLNSQTQDVNTNVIRGVIQDANSIVIQNVIQDINTNDSNDLTSLIESIIEEKLEGLYLTENITNAIVLNEINPLKDSINQLLEDNKHDKYNYQTIENLEASIDKQIECLLETISDNYSGIQIIYDRLEMYQGGDKKDFIDKVKERIDKLENEFLKLAKHTDNSHHFVRDDIQKIQHSIDSLKRVYAGAVKENLIETIPQKEAKIDNKEKLIDLMITLKMTDPFLTPQLREEFDPFYWLILDNFKTTNKDAIVTLLRFFKIAYNSRLTKQDLIEKLKEYLMLNYPDSYQKVINYFKS